MITTITIRTIAVKIQIALRILANGKAIIGGDVGVVSTIITKTSHGVKNVAIQKKMQKPQVNPDSEITKTLGTLYH